jgi:hypothetical protein
VVENEIGKRKNEKKRKKMEKNEGKEKYEMQ